MDDYEKQRALTLYPEFDIIYGPYINAQDGRSRIVFYNQNERKKSSRLEAKVKLEIAIDRRLEKGETVEHLDNNPINDDKENLIALTLSQNVANYHRRDGRVCQKDIDVICPFCQITYRSVVKALSCGSVECKSKMRSQVAIASGYGPPTNETHKRITPEFIERIRELSEQGVSGRKIAAQLNTSQETVSKYKNRP